MMKKYISAEEILKLYDIDRLLVNAWHTNGTQAATYLRHNLIDSCNDPALKKKFIDFQQAIKDVVLSGSMAHMSSLPALVKKGFLARSVFDNFLKEWEACSKEPGTIFFGSPMMEVIGRH